MTQRSLFAIIIKIIGLYLIISAVILIPQLIATLFAFVGQINYNDAKEVLIMVLFVCFAAGIYILILRYCLFKTEWLIDKLHLDKGFSEEKIELNIHRSTVLKIAVIVIGAILIVDYLPILCKDVFAYWQFTGFNKGFKDNPVSKGIILDVAKIFIGFFLMTCSRLIVNFIERKRKGSLNIKQTAD